MTLDTTHTRKTRSGEIAPGVPEHLLDKFLESALTSNDPLEVNQLLGQIHSLCHNFERHTSRIVESYTRLTKNEAGVYCIILDSEEANAKKAGIELIEDDAEIFAALEILTTDLKKIYDRFIKITPSETLDNDDASPWWIAEHILEHLGTSK
ncbi:MAG: hypothetical protein R3A13_01830 [Bdellovibrionota bacterium]